MSAVRMVEQYETSCAATPKELRLALEDWPDDVLITEVDVEYELETSIYSPTVNRSWLNIKGERVVGK